MKTNSPQPGAPALHSPRRRGAALIIVLAFVVLVTGLVMAFFSRSMSERQISNSSVNQTKVDLFTQGAIEMIVGDLKQEMLAGSSTSTVTTGTVKTTLYTPTALATAIPADAGFVSGSRTFTSGTESDGLNNLVKRSANGTPFYTGTAYTGTGAARACSVSSTTPSLNGRSVTLARWNKPLLIAPTGTNDFTPKLTGTAGFTAPDWILVARDGSNPPTWNANMVTSNTNTTTVVGRYAYAIYDEGGMLDANVAGSPSLSTNYSPYKFSQAYADLTLIIGGTGNIQSTVVDPFVAWRNWATTKPLGSTYTNPLFSSVGTSATNYYNSITSNSTGFLVTGTSVGKNSWTDRMFVSRQQLIGFLQNGVGLSATNQAFQLLTHFSRALEQPSYMANPNRPKVVGTQAPASGSTASLYIGNNTYCGGDNIVNPSGTTPGFLGIRVSSTFTRINGSIAQIGEPLVKTRFPLSRLQLITTSTTASQSNTDPIYQNFGLYRGSNAGAWTYDHGGKGKILTLSAVAALIPAREPDFAELLKATITAGSVGKAGPNRIGGDYAYILDVSGDQQILQIMANLIDQQKTDNYPTWIQFTDTNAYTRSIFGTQDIPYFYRWHFYGFTTTQPSPLLSNSDTVTITSGTTTTIANHSGTGTLSNPGAASYMIIPEVWNPHDANTPVASGGSPTKFQIVVTSGDPTGSTTWQTFVTPAYGTGTNFDGGSKIPQMNPPASVNSGTTQISGSMQLDLGNTANLKAAFREPTLLWRNNYPTGMTLTGSSRKEAAALTGNTYYGILLGDAKISWTAMVNGTNYVCQSSILQRGPCVNSTDPTGNADEYLTFQMQYWNPNASKYITYQVAYAEGHLTDYGSYPLIVNPLDYPNNRYKNPLAVGNSGPLIHPMGAPCDPRSARFGVPMQGGYTKDDLNGNPVLDGTAMINGNASSLTVAQNDTLATSNFVLMPTERPAATRGQNYTYKMPCSDMAQGGSFLNNQMGWYSSATYFGQSSGGNSQYYYGLLSQNNPAVKLYGTDGSTIQSLYYEDPDGVCRRAMGAYVPATGTPSGSFGTSTTTTVGLPMALTMASCSNGVITPSTQSQSRPIILHRQFKTVGEMSYAFRGTPWKNIDFFTPESGDAALLDVFCVNEPPQDAIVAGKVNLNTRNAPVLAAILSGAYRDELTTNKLPALTGTTSTGTTVPNAIAQTLLSITTGTQAWKGPLTNVADLVGHYVYPDPGPVTDTDVYQYTILNTQSSVSNQQQTYAGFSAALSGSNIWDSNATNSTASQNIQRFHEAPIRALAACGQTRVWNLCIDVIAQTGRYPYSAQNPTQFMVEGEKRYWVHVAIDRMTGNVIDMQTEPVVE